MDRSPGWDAKAISDVVKRCYNGYEDLFESRGWPERGSDMMLAVQRHVAETYGSVQGFVDAHK